MRKLSIVAIFTFGLVGCADATRTYPALVVEQRPIGSLISERPKLQVPENRTDLLPPMPPRRPCFDHDTHCRNQ